MKKLEDKRPFGIPRRIWENNTRMALKEICWDGVDSIYMAKDEDTNLAVTNTVMNLWFSKKYGNFLSSRRTSLLVLDAGQSGRYVLTFQRNLLPIFFSANMEASDFFKALKRIYPSTRCYEPEGSHV